MPRRSASSCSPSLPSHPLLVASLLASLAVASPGFDCTDIVSQRVRWNLGELGGPRMVHWVQDIEPAIHNFTFSLDICKPLKKHKGLEPHDECPGNTRVCGVEYATNKYDDVTAVTQVVPIAGDYHLRTGSPLESEVFRLKDSGSNTDSSKEGVRLELSGGRQPLEKTGKPQKAIIEFLCDPSTGGKDTEVDDRPEKDGDDKEEEGEDVEGLKLRRRDDEKKEPEKEPEKQKSLRFLSYKDEAIKGEEWGVLRLEWNTKFACENAINEPKEPAASDGHWGFFTWLIIVVFLFTAAYLIFGSWLNYNRYGARGWDALPHGDTIRDLPYIMGDIGRKVTNTIQGSGSRGGYSAV